MYTALQVENELKQMEQQGLSKADIVIKLAHLCLDWPYVYAAAGEMCTPSWRRNRMGYSDEKYANAIKTACPVLSGKAKDCNGCKWDGCRCFDCRGFTRWILQQVGISLDGGGATTQYESNSNWAEKGKISNMPHDLVCCVFKYKDGRMSHTGLHLGNGYIIHCSTIVKEDKLPGTPAWTHYGIPAGLYTNQQLINAGVKNTMSNTITLRSGSKGPAVKQLQILLNQKGYNLDTDGVYGKKTAEAVKDFQAKHNLTADGVAGAKTLAILDSQGLINNAQSNPTEEVVETDVAQKVWNALYKAIGNPYGVAGVMGNLQAESGLSSKNLNESGNKALGMTDQQYTDAVDSGNYSADKFKNDGYAYGLAQWCYSGHKEKLLKYANEHKKSIGDLNLQLNYLINDLRTFTGLWKTLTNATSVREASDAVLTIYEKPKDQSETVKEKRAKYGQQFFDRFAETSPTVTPIPAAPSNGIIFTQEEFNTLKKAIQAIQEIIKNHS